ncbi:RodZ domain-containing protein [Nitrincola schmidtii]|uniref:RodZ domain-containing protein n=1 Tax=Nitrincola schmidtii TaxID=1730894 RepID=UPI00124DEA06|nr:helix-turn-helix domain-containing protein [Nitrincola schmidtii]
MSVDEQDIQSSRFPGHEFTQARERLHLSIEQISTELHLPIKVIKAIESGNPQSFQNPVFIRGYIRTYAKHLGMDATHYANLYANLPGVDLKPVSIKSTTSVKERDPSKSPFMKVFSWLFVIAIIAIIIWWSREQSGRSLFTTTEPPAASSSEANQPDDVFDPTRLSPPQLPISSSDSNVVDVFNASMSSEDDEFSDTLESDQQVGDFGSVEQIDEVPVEQVADNNSGLFMRFSGDCWVQVRDANDVLLYSGVAAGGSELLLEGELPLSLVIGRREAVSEITFNGEVVDLGRFASGSVARFSLPLR